MTRLLWHRVLSSLVKKFHSIPPTSPPSLPLPYALTITQRRGNLPRRGNFFLWLHGLKTQLWLAVFRVDLRSVKKSKFEDKYYISCSCHTWYLGYRGGSRLHHLYYMIHSFKGRNCGSCSSLDVPRYNPLCRRNLFISPIYTRSELTQNFENNSISSPAYLFATSGISGKE